MSNRKCPDKNSKEFPTGTVMMGRDGRQYRVHENAGGGKRWVVLKQQSAAPVPAVNTFVAPNPPFVPAPSAPQPTASSSVCVPPPPPPPTPVPLDLFSNPPAPVAPSSFAPINPAAYKVQVPPFTTNGYIAPPPPLPNNNPFATVPLFQYVPTIPPQPFKSSGNMDVEI